MFVLDTHAWSDAARGRGKVGRKLSGVPVNRLIVAAPVIYELRRLPKTSPAWPVLNKFTTFMLDLYQVAPLDAAAAEAAADVGLRALKKGRVLNHLDTLIAGIAIARGAVLVTRDKDFKRIGGLSMEDWS